MAACADTGASMVPDVFGSGRQTHQYAAARNAINAKPVSQLRYVKTRVSRTFQCSYGSKLLTNRAVQPATFTSDHERKPHRVSNHFAGDYYRGKRIFRGI